MTLSGTIVWLAVTIATKLLTVAEDCTFCRIFVEGLDWGMIFVASNTSCSRISQAGWFEDGYWCRPNTMWSDRPAAVSHLCGRVNYPRCLIKGHCSNTSRRFHWICRCCSFLALSQGGTHSWDFVSTNTSLYIWLDIFPNYLATHTLWPASYLGYHGAYALP